MKGRIVDHLHEPGCLSAKDMPRGTWICRCVKPNADAVRYAWLRRQSLRTIENLWWQTWLPNKNKRARSAQLFDIAVDHAMAKEAITQGDSHANTQQP